MTKYICVEDNLITSVLDYLPNVPQSVSVYPITDDQHRSIFVYNTHKFDVASRTVIEVPVNEAAAAAQRLANEKNRLFLQDTDWMVLRHMRETALGIPTTLSEDKYLELERQRQLAADSIKP